MEKLTYESAGVSKKAGYESVEKIKGFVKNTNTPFVLGGLGGFGGAVALPPGYKEPVLVSGTDGVGTKLMLAQMMDQHDTVGQDLVAMCVNDVLCHGAKPLYFLDYIACGKNKPDKIAQIVKGVADGCVKADCALVGGETAEMPGMYKENDYDLAGFTTGVVEREKFITGERVAKEDLLIGLSSSGLHSNGFSLVRKICFELKHYTPDTYVAEFGRTLGEELITPTEIYVKDALALLEEYPVHGMCHITGGGFYENIPRMIPDGLCAKIDLKNIKVPSVFDFLGRESGMDEDEMYGTFNMGIGFVFAVPGSFAEKAIKLLKEYGHKPVLIGSVGSGKGKVELCW